MKTIQITIIALLLFSCTNGSSEADDIAAIKQILNVQQEAWSKNDIESFMQGYWKSDSLKFYGSSGITSGWEQTLANYKKRYPTAAETGELQFNIADITKISNDAYWVMGEYHLARNIGDANGTFMIIFKRINGEWKIIGDSSC